LARPIGRGARLGRHADDSCDNGWHFDLIGDEIGVDPQRVAQNKLALPPHVAWPGFAFQFREPDLRPINGEPRPRGQRERGWAPQGGQIGGREHGHAFPLQAQIGHSKLSVRPRLEPGTGQVRVDRHIARRRPVGAPGKAGTPVPADKAFDAQRCQQRTIIGLEAPLKVDVRVGQVGHVTETLAGESNRDTPHGPGQLHPAE